MENVTGEELLRLNSQEHISYKDLAKRFGTTRGTIAGKIKRYKQSKAASDKKPKDKFSDDTQNNTRSVEYSGERILTLGDLLTTCQVDQSEWMVERWIANKWEVGRKATVEHLTWDGGTMSGNKDDDGKINVEPLFQIKAWLIRIKPIAVKPVIKPIRPKFSFALPIPKRTHQKCALILPDPQFGFSRNPRNGELTPFHDRAALSIVIQLAQLIEPDVSIWLGDINDFSGWSDKFIRQPEFYFTTQPALCEASWTIGQIRRYTSGDSFAIEGNHDQRPEKAMTAHLIDAYDLRCADQLDKSAVLSVDNLLGLDRMGVKYLSGYPDGAVWLNDTCRCEHGSTAKSTPGGSSKSITDRETVSVIFGHIHRIEMTTRTIWSREGYRTISAFSPGCLCRIDGAVPGSSHGMQWQQGAAVVWYDDENTTIVPIPINAGRACFQGEIIEAFDYQAEMEKETGYEWKN